MATKLKTPAKRETRGRPPVDTSKFVDLLDAYSGPGTVTELLVLLGVSNQVFYAQMKDDVLFYEAVMRVRNRSDDRVEAGLYARATGYAYEERSEKSTPNGLEITTHEKQLPADPGAAKMWLANRRPDRWREKVVVEIEGSAVYQTMLSAIEGTLTDDT